MADHTQQASPTVLHLWHPVPELCVCAGESVYTVADRSKRRKTADKKAAAAKAAEEAAAVDPSEPWAIHHRQPWADKEVKPAELNDEQKAFLEQASPMPPLHCRHFSRS